MDPVTTAAAINAGASVGGGVLGMIGQKSRERRSVRNQMGLMEAQMHNQNQLNVNQYQRQKSLNEQGHKLQKEMWEYTNYPNQVKMMQEAGLNPALLYGQGGGGGTTVGSQSGGAAAGGSASGGQAPMPMDIGSIIQATMAAAQIGKIKAETENIETDTNKKAGVDTDLAKAQIQSVTQGIENQKAQESLLKAEKIAKDLSNMIQGKSAEDQLDIIKWTGKKIESEAQQAANETYISSKTMEDKISLIKGQAIGQILQNELTKMNISKTDEETKAIGIKLAQEWQKLSQGQQQVDVSRFKEEIKANYPSLLDVGGRAIDGLVNGISAIFGGTPLKTYSVK